MTQIHNSREVLEAGKPRRRRFTREHKLKILDEIDFKPDSIGLILRREGLYSTHLYQWRRWRVKMGTPKEETIQAENFKLLRENQELKRKLKKAETIIEIQKKISEMMANQDSSENFAKD